MSRWRTERKATPSHQDRSGKVGVCVCLCVLCPTDVADGCTAYLCDVVLAIPSFAPPLPSCLIISSLLPFLSNRFPLLFSPLLPSPSLLPSPLSRITSFSTYLPQHSWHGYKGYSLAMMMVDVFCAVLSGGPFAHHI